MRPLLRGVTAVGALAGLGLAYGTLVEPRSFRLRRCTVPVLPPGSSPVRVLHLSDIHLLAEQHAKLSWLARLGALEPDLVVNTGDNLADPEALEPLLRALGRLTERPGVFVLGSNDYYSPVPKNPLRYLARGENRSGERAEDMPTPQLRRRLTELGWHDLTHRRTALELQGLQIELRGTDDAHLGRDDYTTVAGPPAPGTDLAVGVTHAPYLRLLDAMGVDRLDLLLAGHTHGGQVCLPGGRALVTNCDLDTRRVKGLSEHRVRTADGDLHTAALHVSAGLGSSPYAPYRFACPPEATLLTLVSRA